MTKESIANKLSELFDLYKTEILTKEEYELLKSQIIGESEKQYEKFEQQEPFSVQLNELERNQTVFESVNHVNISSQNKKNTSKAVLILIISVFVLVLVVLIKILIVDDMSNSNKNLTNQIPLNKTLENEIAVSDQISVHTKINNFAAWDERMARETVIKELKAFKNWTTIFLIDDNDLVSHKLLGFSKIDFLKEDRMVALTYTKNEDINTSFSPVVTLSLFEFKYNNGWVLSNSYISFATEEEPKDGKINHSFSQIAPEKYAIIIESLYNEQGHISKQKSLFAIKNKNFNFLFSYKSFADNSEAGGVEKYKSDIIINKEGNDFYPIELVEKGTRYDDKKVDNKIRFEFNGQNYIKKSGDEPYDYTWSQNYSTYIKESL